MTKLNTTSMAKNNHERLWEITINTGLHDNRIESLPIAIILLQIEL